MTPQTNRRDRRLHVSLYCYCIVIKERERERERETYSTTFLSPWQIFFGDYFAVEEILFSERIQGMRGVLGAASVVNGEKEMGKRGGNADGNITMIIRFSTKSYNQQWCSVPQAA